jgi:hypothetical protein
VGWFIVEKRRAAELGGDQLREDEVGPWVGDRAEVERLLLDGIGGGAWH